MYLVVGLGNPGSEYKNTRHNIGFQTVDLWCRGLGVRLTGRSFQSRKVRINYQDKRVMLLCPLTYMNRSGHAVRACVDYYDIKKDHILVIHDDLDLPVGRLKIAKNSGAGGHKGVQSIIDHLGSNQFGQLKIGVGRPRYSEAVEDYVLSPFYSDEKEIIESILNIAVQACKWFVSDGIGPAMNKINCQNLVIKNEPCNPISENPD